MAMKEQNPNTLADNVAGRILADITSSKLQEGDLFMTGDQVGEHYSVSRSVAREAISRLQALGVIESRQRKGLLIARPDPVHLTQQWLPMYCRTSDLESLRMLAQFRYALEVGAVDLAIANATDEQMDLLEERVQDFETLASRTGHTPEADGRDLALHMVVLEMTGNALIAGMHRVLSDYFHASTQLPPMTDASKAIREHHIIVEAFRRRDAETARAMLRAHLQTTLES